MRFRAMRFVVPVGILRDMERRRSTRPIPSRSEAFQRAAFSALMGTVIALILLKWMLGLAFISAAFVAVLAFALIFSFLMRITPRTEE